MPVVRTVTTVRPCVDCYQGQRVCRISLGRAPTSHVPQLYPLLYSVTGRHLYLVLGTRYRIQKSTVTNLLILCLSGTRSVRPRTFRLPITTPTSSRILVHDCVKVDGKLSPLVLGYVSICVSQKPTSPNEVFGMVATIRSKNPNFE